MKIALVGNQNSGKTTLFNELTGSKQYVGNWPGVTIEKKEGICLADEGITITDLPGIYSMSPYTMEEIVSRDYLTKDRPDGIINIVDGTNLERNLFLTSQLMELEIPMVLAVNMADVMDKEGYYLDTEKLSKRLNIPVVKISASKGKGIDKLLEEIKKIIQAKKVPEPFEFRREVEEAISELSSLLDSDLERWYCVKIFERDEKILDNLHIDREKVDEIIYDLEEQMEDESENIIIEERYRIIDEKIEGIYGKEEGHRQSISEKIDNIVLNKFLALPIFVFIMFIVYYISISTVGTAATDFVNDGIFGDGWYLFGNGREEYEEAAAEFDQGQAIIEAYEGQASQGQVELPIYDDEGKVEDLLIINENDYLTAKNLDEPENSDYGIWIPGIPGLVEGVLETMNVNDFLSSLVLDGIVAGVGAVLGFLPQMFVLFVLLAILEASGYMSRIAFILDKIFSKFGLSGKSVIPMLIGSGCSVPGILATRTIESEKDRKVTVITTSFIPCSAKLPVIALIAGAIFGGAWWIAPSAYFLGIVSVMISGLILKKSSLFAGDSSPFVMELPDYRLPGPKYILNSAGQRTSSFVKKAGSIVLVSTIVIWFTSNYGVSSSGLAKVAMDDSILAGLGRSIAWIFKPLGWGSWENAVATVAGLVAKENVVSTFGILYGAGEVAENGWEIWSNLAANFTSLSAYSFLAFNLLAAPCFAAIGAIHREMGSWKWTLSSVLYLTIFAYGVSLMIYQFGLFFTGYGFTLGTLAAVIVLGVMLYLIIRPNEKSETLEFSR